METDGRKRKIKPAEILLFPLILINKGLTLLLKKAIGENYGEEVTEDDIMSMVDAGAESGTIEDDQAELISNVFEYNDLRVSDVMTHRVNITAVEEGASLDDIIYLALEKGFSRLPVYEKSVDRITGIIIVKDLLSLIGSDDLDGFDIKDFRRDTVYVPESCTCSDAFKTMTEANTGMAVVVDEYGGTAGIVTLEDIIESVMGNIQDEYDAESAEIRKIGDGKYEISGEADPEEVLELFGRTLPEDHEYDTISGLVTDTLGYLPGDLPEDSAKKPHVDFDGIRFVIIEVQDNCIEKLIAFDTLSSSKN